MVSLFIQAEYLEPHLHGVMAFFNFVLVRLDYFENSAKGKLVSQVNTPGGCWKCTCTI